MCTHYPPLGDHSVDAEIAEEEEAEGGAEGGFAEEGFKEGVVKGVVKGVIERRILKGVAEEGINMNKGLKKRGEKFEEGGITLSDSVGVTDVANCAVVVVEEAGVAVIEKDATLTEEEVVENGEGALERGGDNSDDNTQGKAEANAEGDANGDGVSRGDGGFEGSLVGEVKRFENVQDGVER